MAYVLQPGSSQKSVHVNVPNPFTIGRFHVFGPEIISGPLSLAAGKSVHSGGGTQGVTPGGGTQDVTPGGGHQVLPPVEEYLGRVFSGSATAATSACELDPPHHGEVDSVGWCVEGRVQGGLNEPALVSWQLNAAWW